ncbi:MAG: DUF3883 domain-containing protein [Firmicutes bacterium]|nr:DUF3883 domain-containing protein [Bacillota bacterium]
MQKLLDRLEAIRADLGDSVFDVVGEVFPGSHLERLMRELYARKIQVEAIEERIVQDIRPERFAAITRSALEGLAIRDLNLAGIMRRSTEMKERRLVPEVVERFFLKAAPSVGVEPRQVRRDSRIYRIGKLPHSVVRRGEALETRFGRIGLEYDRIAFDKAVLKSDPTVEWVTPGHPLFEAVRAQVEEQSQADLGAGTVLFDPEGGPPRRLDVFVGSVVDGGGQTVHRRLFAVEVFPDGRLVLREPTYLLDLEPARADAVAPGDVPSGAGFASADETAVLVLERGLNPLRDEAAARRRQEMDVIERHATMSLEELIQRASLRLMELEARRAAEPDAPGLAGQAAQAEEHVRVLTGRLEAMRRRVAREREVTVGELRRLGSAWVLPHPAAAEATGGRLRRNDETERIAMEAAMAFERSKGWEPQDVSDQDRGFDILSRDSASGRERAIEVKGCEGEDEVFLTPHEHEVARIMGGDYWLYVVYHCRAEPEIVRVRDPARLELEPVRVVERWRVPPSAARRTGITAQDEEGGQRR